MSIKLSQFQLALNVIQCVKKERQREKEEDK